MPGRRHWLNPTTRPLVVGVVILIALGILLSLRPTGFPPLFTVVLVGATILLLAGAAMTAAYRALKDFSSHR